MVGTMSTLPETPGVEVMLVDNDEHEIERLSDVLAGDDLPVHLHVMRSSVEALAYLHPSDHLGGQRRPQVILIEVDHATCHGFDVLDRVMTDHRLASIPVVLLTNADHGPLPAYYAGRCQVVAKPLQPGKLHELLQDCLQS